jgi:hypothetical protein
MNVFELASNVLDLKDLLARARKVSRRLASETTYPDLVKAHDQISESLNIIQEFIVKTSKG